MTSPLPIYYQWDSNFAQYPKKISFIIKKLSPYQGNLHSFYGSVLKAASDLIATFYEKLQEQITAMNRKMCL